MEEEGSIAAEEQEQGQEQELATFGDRAVAFTIDYALCAAGFFLTLKLAFPKYPVLINPHGRAWAIAWIVIFFIYQALMSCGGRISVGKRLLGIRVLTLDGMELPPGSAALRSFGYALSSILAGGFLWMLTNSARQTWHDMLVGSVVVQTRPKSTPARLAVKAAGLFCVLAFLTQWTWGHLVAEYYYRTFSAANAYVGLKEISQLQEIHHQKYGTYADNLIPLAMVSGDPDRFMRAMATFFDVQAGIDIEVSKDGYVIRARSNNADKTPLTLKGP